MARQARVLPQTTFRDGLAEGWAFGVSHGFKAALDIALTPRVLSRRGSLLRELEALGIAVPPAALAGERHALSRLHEAMRSAGLAVADISVEQDAKGDPRVVVTLETEGRPGAFAFASGDTMHDPPAAHRLPWGEALAVLRRSVQIEAASPSTAAADDSQGNSSGEVVATLRTYSQGAVTATERLVCTQAELVRFLRDGVPPAPGRAPAV